MVRGKHQPKRKSKNKTLQNGNCKILYPNEERFLSYGQIGDEFPEFEIGIVYEGFLAQRKFKITEL